MSLFNTRLTKEKISPKAFISSSSRLSGRIEIADNVSVWPMVVLRADIEYIKIGEGSNVQDGSVLHPNHGKPVIVGKNVTIGHRAIVHGCKIGDNCLIGMGAVILDGAVIEDNCIVSAGSVVPPGKTVKSGQLVMGVPAKSVRELINADLEHIKNNALEYVELARATQSEKTDFI